MHTGEWLREARLASGLPLIEIAIRLREELPRPLWVSTDTIRRVETKADPDPVLAAALGHIYGMAPDDWPVSLRDAVDQVRHALQAGATLTDERSGSSVGVEQSLAGIAA